MTPRRHRRRRRKGYPLKLALWSRLHWRQWEALTPAERLAYEVYVEDTDNEKVAARARAVARSRRTPSKRRS
jgi:hypothetical protein